MAKIPKKNGQVIHYSTYCSLDETELSDTGEHAEQAAFNKKYPSHQSTHDAIESETP